MDLNTQQVQMAAQTGLAILSDKELKISIQVALSGNLQPLVAILSGLANGQVVLTAPTSVVPPVPTEE